MPPLPPEAAEEADGEKVGTPLRAPLRHRILLLLLRDDNSKRSSRRSSSIAAPEFKVNEADKHLFANVKTRMRQYSSKSMRAVSTLDDINSQMRIVETTIEELIVEANAEGAGRDVLVRVKNALALLHGKAETLLYKHVDTVITGELGSGKSDARALRKSLVRRANNIIESVDKLFGFINLHVLRIKSESSNGDSESEDDGASDFEDAHDSDFEDAEDDVEVLFTMDMDEQTAKAKANAMFAEKNKKPSSLSKFARVIMELYETEKNVCKVPLGCV